jgi:uncharacterized protein (DUF2147 family)
MEALMKTTFYLAAAAALLMASTAAHAGGGISFEIEGQKIHIEASRNCNSLSCLQVTNNGSAINLKNINLNGKKKFDDDDNVASSSNSAPPPPPATNNYAPPPPPPAANNYAPPPPPAANNYAPPPPPPPPASNYAPPPAQVADTSSQYNAPAGNTAQTPVASYAQPVQQAAPPPPPPANDTPVGVWQTADNKGNVRIEQCGTNLCGYSEKTNAKVLINMKPSSSKWSGRIHDPDSGNDYDSTIAMKGPNLLKVQGCAFGGMFCGGQTWKRVS